LDSWHGLKEGDEVELEIKERARDGRGVARLRGCIVFVDGASVGEKVKVKITRLAARHVNGQVIKRLGK
jgi:predicted RNA-binding protein with TRAM domain